MLELTLAASLGGSWQAFMAWVPNASAMQIAEPWKPLPPEREEEKKGAWAAWVGSLVPSGNLT